jgi:hypothetical protein
MTGPLPTPIKFGSIRCRLELAAEW